MPPFRDKIRNLILEEYRSVLKEAISADVWKKVENYPFAIIPAKDFEKPIIFRNEDRTKFVQTMAKLIAKDPLGTLGKKIAGVKDGGDFDLSDPGVLKKYIEELLKNSEGPITKAALEINPRFTALLGFKGEVGEIGEFAVEFSKKDGVTKFSTSQASTIPQAAEYFAEDFFNIDSVSMAYKTSPEGKLYPVKVEKGKYDFDDKQELFSFLKSDFGKQLLANIEDKDEFKAKLKKFLEEFEKIQGSKKGKEWDLNILNFYMTIATKVLNKAENVIQNFREEQPTITEAEVPINTLDEQYKLLKAFAMVGNKVVQSAAEGGDKFDKRNLNTWWASNTDKVQTWMFEAFTEVGYEGKEDEVANFVDKNATIDRFFRAFKAINNKLSNSIKSDVGEDPRPTEDDVITFEDSHEKLLAKVLANYDKLRPLREAVDLQKSYYSLATSFKNYLASFRKKAEKDILIRKVIDDAIKAVIGTGLLENTFEDEKDPLKRFILLFQQAIEKTKENEGTDEVKFIRLRNKTFNSIEKTVGILDRFYDIQYKKIKWGTIDNPDAVAKFNSLSQRAMLEQASPEDQIERWVEKYIEIPMNKNEAGEIRDIDGLLRAFGTEALDQSDTFDQKVSTFKKHFNKVVINKLKSFLTIRNPALAFENKKMEISDILDAMTKYKNYLTRDNPDKDYLYMLKKDASSNLTEQEDADFFGTLAALQGEVEAAKNYDQLYGVFGFDFPNNIEDKDKPRLFKAKFNKIFMNKFRKAAKKLNEPHPAKDIRKILPKLNLDPDILKKLSRNIEAIPRKAAGDIKTALLRFNKSKSRKRKKQYLNQISVILDLFLSEQKLQQKLMPLIRERLKGG